MRCGAIVRSEARPNGKRCVREAEAGSKLCPYHRARDDERRAREEELRAFRAEERERELRKELAEAAQLDGLSAEVALMRVLIRRMVGEGKVEAARRGIDTLARMLQPPRRTGTAWGTRRVNSRTGGDGFSPEFERVLLELGMEEEGEDAPSPLQRGGREN